MCLLRNVTLGYRVCVTNVQCKALMKELNMLASKKFLEAGDFLQELSAQEIDAKAPETGGGCWSVPHPSSCGYVCTVSWECSKNWCQPCPPPHHHHHKGC